MLFKKANKNKEAERADGPNTHAFGTSVTHPACAGCAPEASGYQSSRTFGRLKPSSYGNQKETGKEGGRKKGPCKEKTNSQLFADKRNRSKKERVRPLSEFRADAESYCASASEATRRLALSGLAVIWIFREAGSKNHIAAEFLFPAVLFVSAIALDFLQYAVSAIIWTIFVRFHETRTEDDSKKVDSSVLLPLPSYIFFWLKLGVVTIAYIQLIPQMWDLQK